MDRKILDDIGEGFVGHRMDSFDFEDLREAPGLGVVVRVTAARRK
jgi:hypothetical protein